MFTFLSKDRTEGIDKRALKTINDEVVHFLQARNVQSFKVYTIDYERNPIVLIQAVPQKKLRFSNILEVQIKRHLREKLGYQIPAVFWRFKTDETEEPGPEQADYEFEESPEYPQDPPSSSTKMTMPDNTIMTDESMADKIENEHYDVRHLARKGMEVEEISMGEFDEFLKGKSAESPDQQ